MNSGGQLPYQLRPNKAVERLMFIELLGRLDPDLSIGQNYRYVGFGGPQMEDFRLLHERFPVMKMLSLEKEKDVLISFKESKNAQYCKADIECSARKSWGKPGRKRPSGKTSSCIFGRFRALLPEWAGRRKNGNR
jgi:hypothetical protein